VEAKKAVPKEDTPAPPPPPPDGGPQKTRKIFVGGLAPTVDDAALRAYFEGFGAVEDAVVMYDHDNKRPRGVRDMLGWNGGLGMYGVLVCARFLYMIVFECV
jgi:RNA recognition motif-containing protein